ncbi:GNAT family N-acetyltransferase [Sphingomonas sp. QA11]|uniref:GNAT family N-acetyltransferase n=1 Tax=Sphingomonas sp. QA11 TaxID=2950605 RepID=UPI00234B4C27|nr:GNAT family N-acetyltransferase [Sphingomonas sp. QA11]WCM28362.1 GNAT family N-acetyltransferase [Sphingomonas sp. QA11]
MSTLSVDPMMLHAWLAARSIARGLPAPVPEHGGFRVETHTDEEIRRWVFPRVGTGLVELGRTIHEPLHLLKLCGPADALLASLPHGWQLHPPTYFMTATTGWTERPLPAGYSVEVSRRDTVIELRVMSDSGDLAASGYAAETAHAFIYDRIITAPDHRRKGLGHVVMAGLSRARQNPDIPQLLVATEEGRALYSTLGWRTLSPYSTASIMAG